MAGAFEIWAARLWNVFNEGRPFSVVFPLLVLLAAAPLGLGPEGSTALALVTALAVSAALVPFPFALRGRWLLWLALAAAVPLVEPWRAPGLLAGALAGYAFFTVLFWGTLYYRLRTGAPWTNFARFWRLVLTNSDPTSGNALEQLPKLGLTLSAAVLVAEAPTVASLAQVVAAVALTVALGALAARRFARARLPRYPATPAAETLPETRAPLARRVYVIVVDGCNRERLWQARTPTLDRLAREGSELLGVEPAYPARTVVCFSSMLTGAPPAEHGMRSNFAPRLGVRCESIFDVLERHGRRGRLVGIAHLLDPFGERVVRPVSSVQPTERIDASLCAAARDVVEREDPDLLVLQLLAADQIGHVRGTRNREYVDQLERTDRHVGDFLAFLGERGKLDGATVVLMADHGQGRGIGGHGHLDWGERPVPFVVHGAGAAPGAVDREPRSVLELAATLAALLGVPAPVAARGRPLLSPSAAAGNGRGLAASQSVPRPAGGSARWSDGPAGPCDGVPKPGDGVPKPGGGAPKPGGGGPATVGGRCLAIVPAKDEQAAIGGVLARIPRAACGMQVDVLVVDDGSRDATAAIARAAGAELISHARPRGVGAALRSGISHARERGYAAAVYLDGDGEYDAAELPRLLEPVARGRADYVCGSRFLGERSGMSWHRSLANRAATALVGTLMDTVLTDAQTGMRAFSARALAAARIRHDYNYAQVLTLSLWGAGIEPLELPISYRRRTSGRSFVRYPEYLARVPPSVLAEWRAARRMRRGGPRLAAPAQPLVAAEPALEATRGRG